jgi:hypothetical protein
MHSTRWGIAATTFVPAAERYLAGAPAVDADSSASPDRRRWPAWIQRRRSAPAGMAMLGKPVPTGRN